MTMNKAQAATKTMSNQANISADKLDPIAVLREELTAAAICHGVERIDDLVDALVGRFVRRLGGEQIYVRMIARSREEIEQGIRDDFDGRNQADLARRYGVSLRTVYRVLGKQKKFCQNH